MEQEHTINEKPIIVGLDIGTTKVVAIAGRKNAFGKLEILGFGQAESQGVNHGVVLNIDKCIHSIEKAVNNCLNSNPNLEINEVYVGIAGQHIRSIQTRGDRVRAQLEEIITQEDIELLINDQRQTYIPAGDQIIDIIPQDFTVDNSPNILNPVGMCGVKVGANFHIITGDKNAIRNIRRCVDKANLKTVDLVLQPLASAASVMTPEDLEMGVAIVDIGGGTTDLAVYYDGMLKHTAVISYAGTNITEDIRRGLGVLQKQAEAMKTQYGMAIAGEANENAYISIPGIRGLPSKEISVKNLAHIIEARMKEILDHVVYHLKNLNFEGKLHGGIILTGGGSQLVHVRQLTEFVTGMTTRIGQPIAHVAGEFVEIMKHPKYATCIGLILRGYADFEDGRFSKLNKEIINDTSVVSAPILPVETEQHGGLQLNTNESENLISNSVKREEEKMLEDTIAEKEEKDIELEDEIPTSSKRAQKIIDSVKKIVNPFKKSFISLFENPDEDEMK